MEGAEGVETLKANLAAIRRDSPAVADQIEAAEERADIEWIETREGPSARIDGKPLASGRAPLTEGERLAGDIPLLNGVAIAVGFGLGYHVAAMADRFRKRGVVVVYEPDVPLLKAVLSRVDVSRAILWNKVRFLADASGPCLSAATQGYEALAMFGTALLIHPSGLWRIPDVLESFTDVVRECIATYRTLTFSNIMLCRRTARNAMMNLDHYVTQPAWLGPDLLQWVPEVCSPAREALASGWPATATPFAGSITDP